MRKMIFTLFLCIFFYSVNAQNSRYERNFPDRYSLELPKDWSGHKLIRAITEILPKTIPILKEKEFCTDCKANYTVRLLMNSPRIKSRNNISKGSSNYSMEVVYQFRAALGVFDSAGKNIINLMLVLPREEHVKRKDTMIYTREHISEEMKELNNRSGRRVNIPFLNEIPVTNSLQPTLYELMDIAEQRVYAIRKVLKKKESVTNTF